MRENAIMRDYAGKAAKCGPHNSPPPCEKVVGAHFSGGGQYPGGGAGGGSRRGKLGKPGKYGRGVSKNAKVLP